MSSNTVPGKVGAADFADEVRVNGVKVVGARQPAVADPTGGLTVDTQTRTALLEVLDALRAHGLIET